MKTFFTRLILENK